MADRTAKSFFCGTGGLFDLRGLSGRGKLNDVSIR
jgi:hypothetical protein